MRRFILVLLFVGGSLHGDVLLHGQHVIRYDLGESWQKRPVTHEHFVKYENRRGQKVIVQLFKNRKWSQWHMKGLPKAQKTFQKFFDTELGGATGDQLQKVAYDEKRYVLSLTWLRPDKTLFLSRMKLTSFGCVAIHMNCREQDLATASGELDRMVSSLKIPPRLLFIPEDITSELLDEMGSGVVFVFLSLLYLMFSLFKRGQLRQRRLERQLKEARKHRMTLSNSSVSVK